MIESPPRHLASVECVVGEADEILNGTLARAQNYEGPCWPALQIYMYVNQTNCLRAKMAQCAFAFIEKEADERTHTRASVCACPSRSKFIFLWKWNRRAHSWIEQMQAASGKKPLEEDPQESSMAPSSRVLPAPVKPCLPGTQGECLKTLRYVGQGPLLRREPPSAFLRLGHRSPPPLPRIASCIVRGLQLLDVRVALRKGGDDHQEVQENQVHAEDDLEPE